MSEEYEELEKQLIKELQIRHFDGNGCGTHGINACSNCFGPSPMSAQEVIEVLMPTIIKWKDNNVLF